MINFNNARMCIAIALCICIAMIYMYVCIVLKSVCMYLGVIIDGPDTVIYHPGQGPVELTCNVTTEGVILWMINGFKFTLTQLANGAVVNHSNNGLNIVINVPVNNTEYVCVEALQLSDILSDPVFIYLAGIYSK